MQLQKILEDLNDNFVAFQKNTGDRIRAIEKAIDGLETKAGRLPAGGEPAGDDPEYVKAFDDYLRTGDPSRIPGADQKSMIVESPQSGGYAVPVDLDRALHSIMFERVPFRQHATVIESKSAKYLKNVVVDGAGADWAGETDERAPDSATPTFAQVEFEPEDLWSLLPASQRIVDDVDGFSVQDFLRDEAGKAFSHRENEGFVSGPGHASNQPAGFLNAAIYPRNTDPERSFSC